MAEKLSQKPGEPPVAAELRALVEQAQRGDTAALPRIQKILDDYPDLWRHCGDLAALVERAWIDVIARDNAVVAESINRSLAEMKRDLAGEHSTRLEKMAAEQVVALWLEVKYTEGLSADSGPSTVAQAGRRLKRLESAQQRYREALSTLATIRKVVRKTGAPAEGIRYNPEAKRAARGGERF
jgi:hypothetical protein